MKRRHFFSAVAALAASPVIPARATANVCLIGPETSSITGVIVRDALYRGAAIGGWVSPVIGNCIDAPMESE